MFSWHKKPASVFWLPHRTTSPCGAAPSGLLPRVASRTIRRSPGSPRIRGTGRRFRPTKLAARNGSRLLVPPLTTLSHGGNETQGRSPAEERCDLALPHGTFPRERGGVPPDATQGSGLQSDPLGVCPPGGRLGTDPAADRYRGVAPGLRINAREEQPEPAGLPPARLRRCLPRGGAAANPPLLRRGDRTAETKTLRR